MTVIWSRRAARELYAVYEYIATDNQPRQRGWLTGSARP